MKSNVDLTENRMFISNNRFIMDFAIRSVIGVKFPWNIFLEKMKSEDESDLEHQRKSIIATGNKETRAKIRFYREMDDLDYCDCCGKRINLKPWDWEFGVCHSCNDRMLKEQEDKCKWRKLTKETIRNAPIL